MKAHIGLHMLRLFCHVYQTRSVSVAAERCAISQSAASYLLAQTREQTGDPLFVRNREGMVPAHRNVGHRRNAVHPGAVAEHASRGAGYRD